MSSVYYEAVDRMQKTGVDPEYIIGWASGYLHNPKREEQRVSEAHEAGYAHGLEQNTVGFEAWIRK
jgi:tyrosyl-tRNA synthetase